MSTDTNPNIAQLIAAASVLAQPLGRMNSEFDRSYAVVPEGFKVHDLESYLRAPVRIRQKTQHQTIDSFLQYIADFSTVDSRIFAVVAGGSPKFVAVIDFHEKNNAAWCNHIAEYACIATPEWTAWSNSNGKSFSQTDFARFIEDNAPDIVQPSSADMLAMSRTIMAKKNVEFKSDIRLDNGQVQFKYAEEIQGSVTQGVVQIPDKFILNIPVFQGGEIYALEARFRYRLGDGGKLSLSYELWRSHKVIEAAANRVIAQIKDKFPNLPVHIGTL